MRFCRFLVTGMPVSSERSLALGFIPMNPTTTQTDSTIFFVPIPFSLLILCFRKVKGDSTPTSQIDHVVFRQKHRNSIRDCQALTFRPFQSDHRLLTASVRLSMRATPPKKGAPRYDWSSLKNPATLQSFRVACKNRFSELACAEECHKEQYTAYVSAVTSAAKDHLPTAKSVKRRVPWESTGVQKAREVLAKAKAADRQSRTETTMAHVASASLTLARQYVVDQEKFISAQIDRIDAADESRKSSEVWRAINDLSGRKSKPSAKIRADNPRARLAGWKSHFEKLLNNETSIWRLSFAPNLWYSGRYSDW